MRYWDLDPRQLAPVGIPINETAHVEPRGFLNAWYLRAFEGYLSLLFNVENGTLKTDYAKSCAAPITAFACEYCTNAQLQEAIGEWGFAYYSANDHDVNAHFLHALYSIPWGTPEWTTAIARYAANSNSITTSITYKLTSPYEYDLTLHGDLAGEVSVSTMLTRIIENLGRLGTAHTKIDSITATDMMSETGCFVGCTVADVAMYCDAGTFPQETFNLYLTDSKGLFTMQADSWYPLYNADGTHATRIPIDSDHFLGYFRYDTNSLRTENINVFSFTIMNGISYAKTSVYRYSMIGFAGYTE